ncbi:MAG: 4-alpha-glucanotransferase, partial [Gemmatimonadota bacterium]
MSVPRGLHALARLHGVQTAYHDNDGRRVSASPESLLAALRALRVELDGTDDIPRRVERRRRTHWDRPVEPVTVAWVASSDGTTGPDAAFRLRTSRRLVGAPVRVEIELEEGGSRGSSPEPDGLGVIGSATVEGTDYVERRVPIPAVPPGYHDLIVEVGSGRSVRRQRSLLIAAPVRAWGWERLPGAPKRPWGVFAPLYALWRREGGGTAVPSYGLLAELADRVADAGGNAIGTLPLLAAFLDDPYEPSPYAPVSRLFWNELYVAPRSGSRPVGPVGPGAGEPGRYFDPRAAMASLRPVLEEEARGFYRSAAESTGPAATPPSDRDAAEPEALGAFRERNPLAEDYARFRALVEERGPWERWPDRLRARDVRPGDFDEARARYHLYVQWRAERQLAEAAERATSRGVGLYLDLPLGVHS